MSAHRSRKEEFEYRKYLQSLPPGKCVFCDIKSGSDQLIRMTKYFKVIYNIFPYSIWDSQHVVDHIMITPKKHTDTLAGMSDKQKVEYVNILVDYETKGYNVYARAPVSSIKTIVHQHTHLIKTEGSIKKFLIVLRKPFLRIVS